MNLKTGKKPATYDRRDLLFANYVDLSVVLPQIPMFFGHEDLIPSHGWGMLGNDRAGDCVFAGSDHETMLWAKEGGHPALFTPTNALSDYSAVTGYDPKQTDQYGNNPTDIGTNVRDALRYRQSVGVVDANGKRHKIGAYAALEPGNRDHIKAAMYLFSAVGIGIRFPQSAMDQFLAGRIWSVVSGAKIDGGHYIPLVAVRLNHWVCVTWSRLQNMTVPFYSTYCEESWAILSDEMLIGGKTLEGFDLPALQADLAALKR